MENVFLMYSSLATSDIWVCKSFALKRVEPLWLNPPMSSAGHRILERCPQKRALVSIWRDWSWNHCPEPWPILEPFNRVSSVLLTASLSLLSTFTLIFGRELSLLFVRLTSLSCVFISLSSPVELDLALQSVSNSSFLSVYNKSCLPYSLKPENSFSVV